MHGREIELKYWDWRYCISSSAGFMKGQAKSSRTEDKRAGLKEMNKADLYTLHGILSKPHHVNSQNSSFSIDGLLYHWFIGVCSWSLGEFFQQCISYGEKFLVQGSKSTSECWSVQNKPAASTKLLKLDNKSMEAEAF